MGSVTCSLQFTKQLLQTHIARKQLFLSVQSLLCHVSKLP